MEVIKTDIDGVVIIEPRVFKDARGYFFESYNKKEFDEKVRPVNFVQDNESMSTKGVMRGLHYWMLLSISAKAPPPTAGMSLLSLLRIIIGNSSFPEVSHTDLQCFPTLRYSSINVTISMPLRPTAGYR